MTLRVLFALLLLAALRAPAAAAAEPTNADTANAEQIAVHKLDQDLRIAEILQDLQRGAPKEYIILRNVQIVDIASKTVTPGQSVVFSAPSWGRIGWTGKMGEEPSLPGAVTVDGGGAFLAPGLVDMHIHSESASGWLLNLAYGITTVREMAGFPWLLGVRDQVNAGRMLGPVLYVAGTILNAQPLFGYAVVPANSEDARRIVRQEAACGYDFIKIHNILPEPMFRAVLEQASSLGIDVVGHVPHDIPLNLALHEGGLRTAEHLKGFIVDRTLEVGKEDFTEALHGSQTWLTPTLYTRLSYDRGDAARAVLDGPYAKYVSIRTRSKWQKLLQESPDSEERKRNDRLGTLLRNSQDTVMKQLIPLHPRWLAGTDAAGYDFNIMGVALLEEMRLLRTAGVPAFDVLQAAATAPAEAMRQQEEFGGIKKQMRADFVLLKNNPLLDPEAYTDNSGVVAHGVWLERKRIDAALNQLAALQSEPDSSVVVSREVAQRLLSQAETLVEEGYVLDPSLYTNAAAAFRKAGWKSEADDLEGLAILPRDAPCAMPTP